MYSSNSLSPLITLITDHHEAAAEHHADAAEAHRKAATYYSYGDYKQASEEAQSAKIFGELAKQDCLQAMQ